jgi:prepilin-type N-terminal cleavage/methylation domain-containing protein
MNMLKRIQHFKNQSGFTMIELLVVIAVIGVLAVAVLASINPIEQINKGRDTRLRSNAAQLLNAIDRYYAIQEEYPWNSMEADGSLPADAYPFEDSETCAPDDNDFCPMGGENEIPTWLQSLADTEEVKDSFIDQLSGTSANNVLRLVKPLNADISVCFTPASNQFKLEAMKACGTRTTSLPTGACAEDEPENGYENPSVAEFTTELICLP